MDNLTHTLIGLVAGETAARSSRPGQDGLDGRLRRDLLVVLAVVGGNLPDADLLVSYGQGGRLDYLLSHRGYTHTILGCIVLALLLWLAAELWLHRRRAAPSSRDRAWIAGMCFGGVGLHLGMDFLNSYGVHPFWPFDNYWYYGDSLFIIEPLYWIATAPLLFAMTARAARVAMALVLVAALAAVVYVDHRQWLWCIVLIATTVLLLMLGRRLAPRQASWLSAGLMLAITAVNVLAAAAAARAVAAIATRAFPGDVTVDHVLTPAPTNPLCWDVLLVQTSPDRYSVRHGTVTIAAQLLSAQHCPRVVDAGQTTAPLRPVHPAAADEPESGRAISWIGEFSMSRALLPMLAQQHCDAAQLLQFARAPFATPRRDRWIVGDLRFDREPGLGLAEIELEVAPHCDRNAPWIAPRARLLKP